MFTVLGAPTLVLTGFVALLYTRPLFHVCQTVKRLEENQVCSQLRVTLSQHVQIELFQNLTNYHFYAVFCDRFIMLKHHNICPMYFSY